MCGVIVTYLSISQKAREREKRSEVGRLGVLQKQRKQWTLTVMFQAEKEPCQMALCHGVRTHAAVKERERVRVIQSETQESGKGNHCFVVRVHWNS